MARHDRFCVLAAVLFLPLNACDAGPDAASERTPTSTTTTTSTTATPPPPTGDQTSPPDQEDPCTAASLAGSVAPMDSAAGNRRVTIVVRNTSQRECTLRGYGGVELLNTAGEPLPTDVARNLEPAPTLVRLKPGEEAGKILHWSVLSDGDESIDGDCHPPAAGIRINPPDQAETIDVDYEFGSVCPDGRLDTSAYFAK